MQSYLKLVFGLPIEGDILRNINEMEMNDLMSVGTTGSWEFNHQYHGGLDGFDNPWLFGKQIDCSYGIDQLPKFLRSCQNTKDNEVEFVEGWTPFVLCILEQINDLLEGELNEWPEELAEFKKYISCTQPKFHLIEVTS